MLTAISAAMVAAMAPVLQALQAQASRPMQIDVAAPVVHNQTYVHVPEGPAPAVNVAAPNVSVAAPNVNVTNEVQPAAVQVDVNLPTRKIESDITRDLAGDITKIVQTERTIQ